MNLYGDLPTIMGEIQQTGWSKHKYDPIEIKNVDQLIPDKVPVKLVSKNILPFKPRQANIPQKLARNHTTHQASEAFSTIMNEDNSLGYEQENKPFAFDDCDATFDISDSYDPYTPNDYLAYCEERLQKRKAAKLEEENKKKFQAVELLRKEKERERLEAIEKGDIIKLQSSMSGGRGRGGLSNLPAWMSKNATPISAPKNSIQGSPTSNPLGAYDDSDVQIASDGRVHDNVINLLSGTTSVNTKHRITSQMNRPTCVLLLKNMEAPGSIENPEALAYEAKEECEKYGHVLDCVVYEVKDTNIPEEDRIRTFIAFETQESSIKALRDLNGRYFAGRQIMASFYDEDKFKNRNLYPD